jgi:Tol biopolymer transport system component/tRNA A-37 threonylcarbamoyl transferase component Bud32
MNTSPGSRVDHYEIIELIGKGGMGEVYRAKDTRLPREAAIKVSAEQFSERFAREAKIIASLNHPNISTLYDVGAHYLVMELVEGPTLADRIKQGPLSLGEASAIARQIADALDYAHEKGVVHRDLKPGNIKIRPDGVVKVLDFGLARIGPGGTDRASGTDGDNLTNSPTMTAGQTEAGMILGTAAYMSPEQAKGRDVDKRADIWAFGVVFYEMLSGTPLYQGDTLQETIASVLKDEPDYQRVPAQTHRLLKQCMEKDPQKRLRHIGDVMLLLDAAPVGPQSGVTAPPLAPPKKNWLWPAVAAGIVAIIIVGVAALAIWAPWRSQTGAGQAVRFEVGPAEKMTFTVGGAMAVSPDGHWMVFPATGEDGVTRFWLRSLDTVEVRALPGTETTDIVPPASWSWDSRYVIFTVNNKLKKIDIQGGPPQTLADVPRYQNGAAWNRAGVVVLGFSAPGPLLRVSASGGVATPATVLDKDEANHRWPQFLPDGRHFLYQRVSSDPNRTGVYIGSIDAKPDEQSLKRLLASDRQAYYAASPNGAPGYLVFLRETTLMAQPFDPAKMELSGEPSPIAEGVDSFSAANYGLFSVSDTGALVYRGGAASRMALTWFDQQGNPGGTLGEPGEYANPAVSPDGTRVAVALGPTATRDIWILDVARATATRFTFDSAADDNPVWSPDGKSIVFSSNRSGRRDLYIKPADGSGEERLLFKSEESKMPTSWSKDGRFLLFTSVGPKTDQDIWKLPMQGEAKPLPILQTPFEEKMGQFSPDDRWIAYSSNESGAFEPYVRPFSPEASAGATAAKWKVSKGTGENPRWRADGKELFYTTNLRPMAVDIDTSKGFQAGTPRRLFAAPPPVVDVGWDVAPDGSFLFVAAPGDARTIPFTVVLNWAAALKK